MKRGGFICGENTIINGNQIALLIFVTNIRPKLECLDYKYPYFV